MSLEQNSKLGKCRKDTSTDKHQSWFWKNNKENRIPTDWSKKTGTWKRTERFIGAVTIGRGNSDAIYFLEQHKQEIINCCRKAMINKEIINFLKTKYDHARRVSADIQKKRIFLVGNDSTGFTKNGRWNFSKK